MEENLMQFGAMPTNPLLIVISGLRIGKDAVVGLLRKAMKHPFRHHHELARAAIG